MPLSSVDLCSACLLARRLWICWSSPPDSRISKSSLVLLENRRAKWNRDYPRALGSPASHRLRSKLGHLWDPRQPEHQTLRYHRRSCTCISLQSATLSGLSKVLRRASPLCWVKSGCEVSHWRPLSLVQKTTTVVVSGFSLVTPSCLWRCSPGSWGQPIVTMSPASRRSLLLPWAVCFEGVSLLLLSFNSILLSSSAKLVCVLKSLLYPLCRVAG